MGLFSRKKTPNDIGLELSKRLKKSIETFPKAINNLEDIEAINLEDIDNKKIIWELAILTFSGQRLALQLASNKKGERDETKRREICNSLDRYALEFLDDSQEFNDLLDKRGEQYFNLIQSHNEEIGGINWEKFLEALHFEFGQFCRGGGDGGPIVIGNFSSMLPLNILATQYWTEGFTNTVEYINEQGI